MNAVEHFARLLPPPCARRLAVLRHGRFERAVPTLFGLAGAARHEALDNDESVAAVIARWRDDLCGLLNAMTRGELAALAHVCRVAVAAGAKSAALRLALWQHGASVETAGVPVSAAVQPRPVILGGHLVIQAPARGAFAACDAWPRTIPSPQHAHPPEDEPDSLDELLAAADRALGVRLGRRGRDKGAWGLRAQALLGVLERGDDEPDWRGDVEIKTLPIARDPSGLWRVVEDPAIAMVDAGSAAARAKLQRTLWLARASLPDGDATIVSWYLLEWDAEVARLARRYLHERPKGPAGTDARGHYLSKRFFADAGLLASLNGPVS
ncbi:MAG TPA: hypothetical protein VFQ53_02415 [Kofleriaceae bacterium]|nr:hypothetical protein [Kofleriaceae bacterium]